MSIPFKEFLFIVLYWFIAAILEIKISKYYHENIFHLIDSLKGSWVLQEAPRSYFENTGFRNTKHIIMWQEKLDNPSASSTATKWEKDLRGRSPICWVSPLCISKEEYVQKSPKIRRHESVTIFTDWKNSHTDEITEPSKYWSLSRWSVIWKAVERLSLRCQVRQN